MTTAIIVQARHGSSRLPGKIMQSLGAHTPLFYVLHRAARIRAADVVVCAVPEGADNDAIAGYALDCGAVVVRGSETDVLGRYLAAAQSVDATTVMRITSDCPLIDPAICDEVLAVLAETGADYVCNTMPPLWPHGLDCDAFPFAHLAEAASVAHRPDDREHVTLWLKRNSRLHRINVDGPGGGLERHRWTLDFPCDLDFFRALWAAMGERAADAATSQILATLAADPGIARINRAAIDENRLADRSVVLDRRIPSRPLVTA